MQISRRVPFNGARSDLVKTAISQEGISTFMPTQSGFSFWLKEIPCEIKIELSINGEQGGFNFRTSHLIKTPLQVGPYLPSRPWGDDAEYALYLAVTSITQYYIDAVKRGLAPEISWLVPSPFHEEVL